MNRPTKKKTVKAHYRKHIFDLADKRFVIDENKSLYNSGMHVLGVVRQDHSGFLTEAFTQNYEKKSPTKDQQKAFFSSYGVPQAEVDLFIKQPFV